MADFYDIDATFDLDAKGDIKMLTDAEAIKQSIYNIIKTPLGFRVGGGTENIQYGLGLNKYLFAPLTQFTAQKLSENIYRKLNAFEPRINIINVHVNVQLTKRQYDITIVYSYKESTQREEFKLTVRQL